MKLTKDNLYQTVDTQYQAHKDSFEAISDYIFRHPEVGGEEIQSATYLTQVFLCRTPQYSSPLLLWLSMDQAPA